jgi:hypothetical protein
MQSQTVLAAGNVTPVDITIALNSIATATGQQGTFIDDSATRFRLVTVFLKIRTNTGAASTANSIIEVYLLRGDGASTEHRSDGAGASDADFWTSVAPQSSRIIGSLRCTTSPSAGDYLYGEFDIWYPGPRWTIGVYNRTGQTTGSTAGDHWARYIGKGAGQGN